MSYSAKFKAAGKEFNVLDCDYSLRQEVDSTGRPSSVTRGGIIRMTVESDAETDLFEWMCNNFERKDGSIVFFKGDAEGTLKELQFKEGYLTAFEERFSSTGSHPMTISFAISAREVSMGRGTHKNEWV